MRRQGVMDCFVSQRARLVGVPLTGRDHHSNSSGWETLYFTLQLNLGFAADWA